MHTSSLLTRETAGIDDLGPAVERKIDEFLDLYSFYRATGIAWIHDQLNHKAHELSRIHPGFCLDTGGMKTGRRAA